MGIIKRQYDTIDGRMIGYHASDVQKDFLTDALGSVTAEVDQSCTKTFEGRYKPFGGELSSTGTRGSYGWVGTWGYRETGLSASRHYIRARHYSKASGTWTSIDRYWPLERPFAYAEGRTVHFADSSGNGILGIVFCLLSDCSTYPGGPCAMARTIPGMVEKNDDAGVICCNGNKIVCSWKPKWSQPGMELCALLHEGVHFDDIDCPKSGISRERFRTIGDEHPAECRAYKADFDCSLVVRRLDCGKLTGSLKTKCYKDYLLYICDDCQRLHEHCGAGNLGNDRQDYCNSIKSKCKGIGINW